MCDDGGTTQANSLSHDGDLFSIDNMTDTTIAALCAGFEKLVLSISKKSGQPMDKFPTLGTPPLEQEEKLILSVPKKDGHPMGRLPMLPLEMREKDVVFVPQKPGHPMGQLSKLPLELREKIYGYVIGLATTEVRRDYPIKRTGKLRNSMPAICYTNHQINIEASLVLIRQTTFDLTSALESDLKKILKRFPERQGFEAVRSLRVLGFGFNYRIRSAPQELRLNLMMFPGLRFLTVVLQTWDVFNFPRVARGGKIELKTWEEFEAEFHLAEALGSPQGWLPHRTRVQLVASGGLCTGMRHDSCQSAQVEQHLKRVKYEAMMHSPHIKITVRKEKCFRRAR
jgi:hypothetical protein